MFLAACGYKTPVGVSASLALSNLYWSSDTTLRLLNPNPTSQVVRIGRAPDQNFLWACSGAMLPLFWREWLPVVSATAAD